MIQSVNIQKKYIRNIMRNYRNKLTYQEHCIYSNRLKHLVLKHKLVQSALNFGLFLSFDGEINTNDLIKELLLQNKKIYLPVLNSINSNELLFVKYSQNSILKKNRLNIFEPLLRNDVLAIEHLDILFVPLVAFDNEGYRLGMGGGFYDRILNKTRKKIFSIGLGYDFQLIKKIPIEPWDVSLTDIISVSK